MHALVTHVTIHNADRTRELLNSQVVPNVSSAPGFQAGYWTWSTGNGEQTGLAMMIFDTHEHAIAAADRIRAAAENNPNDVTLTNTEIRNVVASA
jgi:hypothetical protein